MAFPIYNLNLKDMANNVCKISTGANNIAQFSGSSAFNFSSNVLVNNSALISSADISGFIHDISGFEADITAINEHLDTVDEDITQLQNGDTSILLITSSLQNSIGTQPAGTFIDPPVEVDASGNLVVSKKLVLHSPDETRTANIKILDSNAVDFRGAGSYQFDQLVDIDADLHIRSLDLKNGADQYRIVATSSGLDFTGASVSYDFDNDITVNGVPIGSAAIYPTSAFLTVNMLKVTSGSLALQVDSAAFMGVRFSLTNDATLESIVNLKAGTYNFYFYTTNFGGGSTCQFNLDGTPLQLVDNSTGSDNITQTITSSVVIASSGEHLLEATVGASGTFLMSALVVQPV